MKNKGKKILIIAVFLLLFSLVFTFAFPGDNTQADPYVTYYSGEVFSYKDKLVVGTVNAGLAEIFIMEDGNLQKVSQILPAEDKEFKDLIFNQAQGDLYLYLVDGRHLYQYNISEIQEPILVEKVSDNTWDWFSGLDRKGEYILTLGTKGTKIWNQDLKNISSYLFPKNKYPYNLSLASKGEYVFSLDKEGAKVYNPVSGDEVAHRGFEFQGDHFRKSYYDSKYGLYVVDDNSLGRYWINSSLGVLNKRAEFKHISEHGYDVDGLENSEYVYFSDGIGVVKADKYTLDPVDWIFTSGIGRPGSWAQGLEVVKVGEEEMVVVFNLHNILVLNSNLEIIDYYNSEELSVSKKEDLHLDLNKGKVSAGEAVTLSGGGFGDQEKIIIKYLEEELEIWADSGGAFSQSLMISPETQPSNISITAEGESSDLKRSISLKID